MRNKMVGAIFLVLALALVLSFIPGCEGGKGGGGGGGGGGTKAGIILNNDPTSRHIAKITTAQGVIFDLWAKLDALDNLEYISDYRYQFRDGSSAYLQLDSQLRPIYYRDPSGWGFRIHEYQAGNKIYITYFSPSRTAGRGTISYSGPAGLKDFKLLPKLSEAAVANAPSICPQVAGAGDIACSLVDDVQSLEAAGCAGTSGNISLSDKNCALVAGCDVAAPSGLTLGTKLCDLKNALPSLNCLTDSSDGHLIEPLPPVSLTEGGIIGPPCAVCGNGSCEAGENTSNCCQDCGSCGDDTCCAAAGETKGTCCQDCGSCPDGVCCAAAGENATSCAADCGGGPVCGDNHCDAGETNCCQDCGLCPDGACCAANENKNTCCKDCGKCGDGVCCAEAGETKDTCCEDCGDGCGDGKCCAATGENISNCCEDCGSCPDGVCCAAAGENATSCAADCGGGPVCGNGTCETGENVSNCCQDCGHCGDGACCAANEDKNTCCQDCGSCPDGVCCAANENATSCPADCGGGPVCGNHTCETGENVDNCCEDCGSCPDGKCCPANENATSCPADCSGARVCGNGTCDLGETNVNCPADCNPVCNNGICEPTETPANCDADCGPSCGNGICEVEFDEDQVLIIIDIDTHEWIDVGIKCPADCAP